MGPPGRTLAQVPILYVVCMLAYQPWPCQSAARGIGSVNKGRSLQQAPQLYHFQAWGDPFLLKEPSVVSGLAQENITGIQAIVAGWYHVSVIRADGSAASYGFNDDNQTEVPFLAQQPNTVIALAAGRNFTLALMWNGKVMGWGDNSNGQLDVPIGIQINGGCIAIAAGWDHSLCLTRDNTVIQWGSSNIPFPYPNVNFTAVVAGGTHSEGILSDTSVRTWDVNNEEDALILQPPTNSIGVTQIATGVDYSVIVQNNNLNYTVYGNTSSLVYITAPPSFSAAIKQIFSGDAHVLMLLEDNTVWAWGDDFFHAIDVGQGLVRANAISAGSYTSFALTKVPVAASTPPPTLSSPPPLLSSPPPLFMLSPPPPSLSPPPPVLLPPPPIVLPPPPVLSPPPPLVLPPPPVLSSPPPAIIIIPPAVAPPPPVLSPPPSLNPNPNPAPAVTSVPPPTVNVGVPPPPPSPPPVGSGIIISQSPPPAPDSAVTASGTASSSHKTSAGAVAGGVIGGIVAAAALAVLAVWWARRSGKTSPLAAAGARFDPPPPMTAGQAVYSYDGTVFLTVPAAGAGAAVPPTRLSTLAKSIGTLWYQSLLPSDRLGLALHAAKGLRFMHYQRLIHGCFNTANLLFEDDGKRVVIAASPTSIQLEAAAKQDASIASIVPPEMFTNPALLPSDAADVYAFGIVLLEIMQGSPAYPGMRSADIKTAVLKGSRPDIPGGIDDMVAQTIIACWDQEPYSRPSIDNVVAQLEAVLSKARRA